MIPRNQQNMLFSSNTADCPPSQPLGVPRLADLGWTREHLHEASNKWSDSKESPTKPIQHGMIAQNPLLINMEILRTLFSLLILSLQILNLQIPKHGPKPMGCNCCILGLSHCANPGQLSWLKFLGEFGACEQQHRQQNPPKSKVARVQSSPWDPTDWPFSLPKHWCALTELFAILSICRRLLSHQAIPKTRAFGLIILWVFPHKRQEQVYFLTAILLRPSTPFASHIHP